MQEEDNKKVFVYSYNSKTQSNNSNRAMGRSASNNCIENS